MKKAIQFLVFSTLSFIVNSQENIPLKKNVLFIGNSYTAVNNLPLMTSTLSLSAGDTLTFDSHTPGGMTFEGHSTNQTVIDKIAQANWDFVVLQEQSQRPSFDDNQVQAEVFPFAKKLDSMINFYNPCAETIFYMTWGRQNGDAGNCPFWPPVCTYQGMDSLLYLRYMQLADTNDAIVSPVGKLWNYLRINNPTINLYSPDESHPSLAGTYAAACSFYTTIFKKNPQLITDNYGVSQVDAEIIRNAAKLIVFDSLQNWFQGAYEPQADFTFTSVGNLEVEFTNLSTFADSYNWNFGDQTNPITTENAIHLFPTYGSYEVRLIVEKCGKWDTLKIIITIENPSANITENSKEAFRISPNPVQDYLNLEFIEGEFTYSIYQLDGKIVKSQKLNSKESICLIGLDKSIYLLKIHQNNKLIFEDRFVKE